MDGQTDGRVDGRTKMDASINEQMEWHTNLFSRVHTTKKDRNFSTYRLNGSYTDKHVNGKQSYK